MNIVKKSGNVQEFSKEKLALSILRASDDIKQPLNNADVNYLVNTIETVIKKIRNDNTSAYEVFAVTIHCLNKENFQLVAKSYFQGREGE